MKRKKPERGVLYPLHIHTVNSMLDGVSTVEDYVTWCHGNGIMACSCTDHGYVAGHYDLFRLSKEKGIKPIPGVEAYLMPDDDYAFVEQPGRKRTEFDYFHLTLWARNKDGYRDLMSLTNASWRDGMVVTKFGSPKPRVSWADLERHSENLICGTGCILGPVAYPILRGERHEARKSMDRLVRIFAGRLFVEVMPTPSREDWVKSAVVVESSSGRTFAFMPDDVLETNLGSMTARKAVDAGVSEIYSASPERVGLREFLSGSGGTMVADHGIEILEEQL